MKDDSLLCFRTLPLSESIHIIDTDSMRLSQFICVDQPICQPFVIWVDKSMSFNSQENQRRATKPTFSFCYEIKQHFYLKIMSAQRSTILQRLQKLLTFLCFKTHLWWVYRHVAARDWYIEPGVETLVWYWSCLQYKDSIMEATTHCRENASIFDVSHMCGLTLKVRAQHLQSIILTAYAILTVLGWWKTVWAWEEIKVILDR